MAEKFQAIIITGPPGSGKGTQAEKLATIGKYFRISTGEMLRNFDPTTTLGLQIKKLIDSGKFVSDKLTIDLLEVTIKKYISKGLFKPKEQILILDGAPRTLNQIKLIEKFIEIRQIITLESKEDILIKRLIQRAKLEGRADDQDINIIKKRFEDYKKETIPILSGYPKDKIIYIDASSRIEDVYKSILEKLVM